MKDRGAPSFVYYAERNGLIKIGRSRNVTQRARSLGANLLAYEPGHGGTERGRHAEFRRYAQARQVPVQGEREWFSPTPELLAWIAVLAAVQAVYA